jgi:hypothetical protein
VSQKPTLPTRVLAEERRKNFEHLKRIGRYPMRRMQSVASECQEGRGVGRGSRGRARLEGTQEGEHQIVLFSRAVQLVKGWFTVRVLRFKSHYRLLLSSYPEPTAEHSLQLPEEVGTALLTQTDYDYLFLCHHCLRFTPQHLCLTFELGPQKKKHFYRFETQPYPVQHHASSLQQTGAEQPPGPYRKTEFARENEEREREQQRQPLCRPFEESSEEPQLNRLDSFDRVDIRLSDPLSDVSAFK